MDVSSRLIHWRGRAVALTFLLLGSLWLTTSAQAQTANDYIVQVPEWQALEDDAVRTLQALGHTDPYLTSRNEIRAYVFGQLFNSMKSNVPGAAKNALREKIREFRANAFHNALSSHDWYAAHGCFASADQVGCFLDDFFGEAPNYAEFTQIGTMEAFGDMGDNEQVLQVKLEVARALVWFAAQNNVPDEQLYVYGVSPQPDQSAAFRQFASGLGGQATSQLFGDLVTIAMEAVAKQSIRKVLSISSTAGGLAAGVTIVAGVIVTAYTAYHISDRVILYNTIKDRAENPDDEPFDISKLTTTPSGVTELFEVVLAHTVGPLTVTDQTCYLQSGAEQRSDCRAYTLVDDPDFVDERYTSTAYPSGLPLPNVSGQLNFWHGQQGDDVSLMEITDYVTKGGLAGFIPWSSLKRLDYELPNSPTLGFDESGPWSLRSGPASDRVQAFQADNQSLVSYYLQDWKYTYALNYTNWNNEWWTAWLVGGQYLHKKQATYMPGRVFVTQYNGNNRCFVTPPGEGLFTVGYESKGAKCLLGVNADLGQLKKGDRIFVGGLTRTVQSVAECTVEYNLFHDFDSCSSFFDSKAIVVSEAFPEKFYSYNFSGAPVYDYDYVRWYTPENGRFDDCSEPVVPTIQESMLVGPPDRDCYFSPLFQYKTHSLVLGRPPENRGSLIASPFVVSDDNSYYRRPSVIHYKSDEDDSLEITLPGDGLFVNDRVPTVDHPSGIFPWSESAETTISLLTPQAELHGDLVLNSDGTFTYTPDAALNDWDERDWQQQFQYELCDTLRVGQCASATVTIEIYNNPARAVNPVFLVTPPADGENTYTLSFTSYTYQDAESDPEDVAKTELCWVAQNIFLLQSAHCWFGDEEPITLSVPIAEYIDSNTDWFLLIKPHATRGIPKTGLEPGNFEGIWSQTSLRASNNQDFAIVNSLDLECRPGGEGYPAVSTNNTWVRCTFELSPYVPASIFFNSHRAVQPWTINPFNPAKLDPAYHDAHEKTFSAQLCELEHDLETNTGRCSVHWLSEPVPQEQFPLFTPAGPYTGDTVHTDISGTVLDSNGDVVYGLLNGDGQGAVTPFPYSKTDLVRRSNSATAAILQSPDLTVNVKHNETTSVHFPASPDATLSEFVILDSPARGSADNQLDGAFLYSPGIDACCSEDSFTYQSCDPSDASYCTVPGTITLNVIDGVAPTIEASYSPEANGAGWHNRSVTVNFVCADEDTDIEFCSDTQNVYAQGEGLVTTGFAIDTAGNRAEASVVLNIDKTAPVVTYTVERESSCTYRIEFACEGDLSGLTEDCPAPLLANTAELQDGIELSIGDLADNVRLLRVQSDVELSPGGDLTGDQVIDFQDYNRIRSSLGSCAGEEGYLPEADFIENACIGYDDYQCWYGNYYEGVGEPLPPAPGC